MSELISVYQSAVRNYQAKLKAAKELIESISKVSSSMNYNLRAFLLLNYSIRTSRERIQQFRDDEHRYNMQDWPSADTLQATFREWSDAFEELHRAWNDIPQEDKIGLAAPPSQMDPRF